MQDELSEEDIQMIPYVVDAAVCGEDIETAYPKFYRRLLQDAGLRAMFLDVLAAVETDAASGNENSDVAADDNDNPPKSNPLA